MKTKFKIMGFLAISYVASIAQNTSFDQNNIPLTNGNFNIGFGQQALFNNLTGNENTAIGHSPLFQNFSGNGNTAVGHRSMNNNTTGSNNTAIGYQSEVGSGGLSNATALGANAIVTANNSIQLGDAAVTQIFGGVGNAATIIAGGLQITGGVPANGKVLTSNASGVATWQNLPAGNGWNLTGNLGTNPSTNFIGTIDGMPLNFRVNNQIAGKIAPGNGITHFGYLSGANNTTGVDNTVMGAQAFYSNTSGSYNTVMGFWALNNNITGNHNTGIGYESLVNNTSGNNNTAVGLFSLYSNTSSNNSALGLSSLYTNTSGQNNTGLGANSNVSTGSLNNATAIGANAITNASNKIVVGSTGVTVIGGYASAGWSNLSDGRFKENVKESNVAGLDFILKLRPVNYTFNMKKLDEHLMQNMPDSIKAARMKTADEYAEAAKVVSTGFIAQEVEKTVKEMGVDFDAVNAPKNNTDNYSIGYAKFVVPLVKGMQEQQKMIEELKQEIRDLKKAQNTTGSAKPTDLSSESIKEEGFSMQQNEPNPFTHETLIKLNVPSRYNSAYMAIYDLTGKQIASFDIAQRGESTMIITSEKLSAGIYIYNVIADGKVMDSKKMIVSEK